MKLREGETWQKELPARSDAGYWFGAAAVGRQVDRQRLLAKMLRVPPYIVLKR